MIELNRIYNEDCLATMRRMPGNSVDFIFTDPPYGVGFLSNRTENHKKIINDSFSEWVESFPIWIDSFHRVMSDSAVCCCCCGGGGGGVPVSAIATLEIVKKFNLIQTVIWNKKTMGLGWKYRPSYETILVFSKDKDFKWHTESASISNIVNIGNIIPQKGDHPTPKPVNLVRHFLRLHSEPGDLVYDPFMGSGTTAVACIQEGRQWVGSELDADYCAAANKRIKQALKQPSLFEPEEINQPIQGDLFDE